MVVLNDGNKLPLMILMITDDVIRLLAMVALKEQQRWRQ